MNNNSQNVLKEGQDETSGPVQDNKVEEEVIPHNLTKFSEMNNSIQVLKPNEFVMGE